MYIDTFRGDDATGYAGILKKDPSKYMMYKRAMKAPDFLETNKWAQAYKSMNDIRYFIGHNRKATVGDSWLDENAHPYHRGDIILAHNGSLRNEHVLLPRWRDTCGTDSEILAQLLNHQTVDQLIPKINGAFALTWYDKRDKSMNFIRNDERPFHMATIKGKNLLIWASEQDMLEYVITRNDFEAESVDVLVDGWHVKIKEDVREWEEKEVDLFVPPVTSHYPTTNRRNFPRGHEACTIKERENARVKEQNKLLAKYSLSPGQWVKFNYLNFARYNNPAYAIGVLHGIPYDNKNIEECYIQCLNVNPDDFSMEHTFRGKVKRIVPDSTGITPTIILEDVEEILTTKDSKSLASYKADTALPITDKTIRLPQDKANPITSGCAYGCGDVCLNKQNCVNNNEDDTPEAIKNIAGHSVSPGVKDKRRKYRGPDGHFFRLKDFRKLVSDGCVYCTGPIVASDSDKLLWTTDDRPICTGCGEQHNKGEIDLSSYIKQ